MKKVIAAVMLCVASTSYARNELTAQELVTWCESESNAAQKIAGYKSAGYTQRQVNAIILDGKFDSWGTRAELWTKWLVTMTNLVYQDETSGGSPEQWGQLAYSTCITRLTKKK